MASIKKNFLYNAFYNVLVLILPLITTPYISRVMGAEKIGAFSYSYSIVTYFGLFILLGLNNYGNRTIASVGIDNKEKLSKTFWSIYSTQIIMAIIVIVIYVIYIFTWSSDKLMASIQILYLLSCCLDINWFYFGIEQFKLTVTRSTIIKILNVILILLFVKNPDDIYKYAVILLGGGIVSQLLLWFFLKQYISFVKVDLASIFAHFKPNLKLFIPVLAVSCYTVMDKIMLGALSGVIEVGYYENANKLTIIPTMAVTSLGTVMLPRISNLVAIGKEKETMQYLQKSLIVSSFLSISMSFGLASISPTFVPIFFGPGYDKCKLLIPILVLSTVFISWANVIRTQYLIPKSYDKIYIFSVFLGAFINFVINIILIPIYNSYGAAIATLIAEFIVCFYQSYKVRSEINIILYFKQSLPFLLFGLIMVFLVLIIPEFISPFITLIIKVSIGAIVYLVDAFLYWKYLSKMIIHK